MYALTSWMTGFQTNLKEIDCPFSALSPPGNIATGPAKLLDVL